MYEKNPIGAEQKTKGRTFELFGIVDRIERVSGGVVVVLRAHVKDDPRQMKSRLLRQMDAGQRGIACLFQGENVEAVGRIAPNQLVGIRGQVEAPSGSSKLPKVLGASLSWEGENPDAPHNPQLSERQAVQIDACIENYFKWKPEILKSPMADGMKAGLEAAKRDLAKYGDQARCPNPFLFFQMACEGESDAPPECQLPEIKELVAEDIKRSPPAKKAIKAEAADARGRDGGT